MASTRGFRKPPRAVSERMRNVRSHGTGLEAAMERMLRALNLPFQRQPSLPGRPDFRVRGTNVVIFCDSSFWHGRHENDRKGRTFHRNRDLWVEKLIRNRRRDARTNRNLRATGWSVHRFWDTDIESRPEVVMNRLRRIGHDKV